MDFSPERLHVYAPQQDNLKGAMTVPHHLFLIQGIWQYSYQLYTQRYSFLFVTIKKALET